MHGAENDLPMLYFFYREIFHSRQMLTCTFHESLCGIQFENEIFKADRSVKYGYSELIGKVAACCMRDKTRFGEYLNLTDSLGFRPAIYSANSKWVHDVVHESMFSDMLIIAQGLYFQLLRTQAEKLGEMCHQVLAPVIITPRSHSEIENVIMVYDGSLSSIRAIKTFSRLFPGVSHQKQVYILNTSSGRYHQYLDDEEALMKYARYHLPGVAFMRMEQAGLLGLLDFAVKIKNHILVQGFDKAKNSPSPDSLYRFAEDLDSALFISH